MQLFYDNQEKHQIFLSHLPNLAKMGIGLHSFPNLDVYIGMDYPNFAYPTKTPHVLVGRPRMIMYIPVMVWSEAQALGWSREFFDRTQAVNTNTIEHEFGHVVHFTHFGNNDSDTWWNVWKLMNREGQPDFLPSTWGSYTNAIRPYEDFANYFADMAIGKITNAPLGQFLCELLKTTVLTFKQDSAEFTHNFVTKKMDSPLPTISGRTYLPIRTMVEELKGKRLEDVSYNSSTREVHILA